jgi:hypothetical protein
MTKKTDAQRIAKLERELAALKAAQAPPPPFKPEPWQQFDPTANMSMPRSTLLEMAAAIPDATIKGIVRDNRAPTGRPGVIPGSQQVSSARHGGTNAPGDGTGWAREVPLGPQPGINHVDRLIDEQDRRDRVELAERLAKQQR